MRSPALPLLAVALLIAVAWGLYSWLDDRAWSEPAGNAAAGTETQDTAGARPQQGASHTLKAAGDRTELADTRSDGMPPSGDHGPAKTPKDARTVTIQVVVAETDKSVPFAEVVAMHRIFDWMSMSDAEREVVNRLNLDHLQFFKHFGDTHKADSEGNVTLPIDRILALTCMHDGLYGELFLDAETLEKNIEHRLLLRPDQSLRVRVVDGAGRPLPDMPLCLNFLWSKDDEDQRKLRWRDTEPHAITDDRGEAKLSHIQERLDQPFHGDRPDRAVVGLGITGLFDDAPSFTFDPTAPPKDVIELVAPPTGGPEQPRGATGWSV